MDVICPGKIPSYVLGQATGKQFKNQYRGGVEECTWALASHSLDLVEHKRSDHPTFLWAEDDPGEQLLWDGFVAENGV